MAISDQAAMRRAIKLAQRGIGMVYPNPMVGAVIVKNSVIIGEGWHRGSGLPHAEVEALKNCSTDPAGATMYVTLEPCNHYGKTPPCTEAIITAGIKTVKYAVADPNPKVTGSGAKRLEAAGIKTEVGLEREQALLLNKEFFYHCLTGKPWVIMKAGMSLDGKIALANGQSQWITGEKSRQFVHRIRSRVGAVLVGIGTVLKDNPQLTNRHPRWRKHQPLKVVFDSKLQIGMGSNLVKENPEQLIVFCTDKASLTKEKELTRQGVRVIRQVETDRVDPSLALIKLGNLGIRSVLVEGGHEIFASFYESNLINEYYLFYAPFMIGNDAAVGVLGGRGVTDLSNVQRLTVDRISRSNGDLLVHAYQRGCEPECLLDWCKL